MAIYNDKFKEGDNDDNHSINSDSDSDSDSESDYSNRSDSERGGNSEYEDDENENEDEDEDENEDEPKHEDEDQNDDQNEAEEQGSDSDSSEIHVNLKVPKNKEKKVAKAPNKKPRQVADDEDDDMDNYLQKFDVGSHQQVLIKHHPELASIGPLEMIALSKIERDDTGKIIDPLHTTIPFLTKYERTHVIGVRASQLDNGSPPFIELADNIIDSHTIALMEFNAKQLPFIIARPMPAGGVEYWKLNDLERIF